MVRRPRRSRPGIGPILALLLLAPLTNAAKAGGEDADRFFELKIRPVLVAECVRCHGPDTQKAGLRLDRPAEALAGGDSGPAIVPGVPGESLLIEAIRHEGLVMPPKGKLDDAVVRDFERWVEAGASWPGPVGEVSATQGDGFTEADRSFWAFQPLADPGPPAVDHPTWGEHPIDRFLLARLQDAGLQPAARADRRTLIRRLSFDLTGLPPTPEEVEEFERDESPDAYQALVDRLLERPRYGERWARPWLDLVRYAESDGYRADAYRPHAWRYRQYVIESLNADKPYDRFVAEQLAGDLIDPDDPEMLRASQYLRLWAYEFNQRDVETQWANILNDLTDVTGEVFLGMGFACARCHDHKFDPILRDDYYRLQAFFNPILPRDDRVEATEEEIRDHAVREAAWSLLTADLRAEIDAIERPYREESARKATALFQPGMREVIRKTAAERGPRERQLMYLAGRQLVEEFGNIDARIKGDERKRYDELKKQLAAFDPARPEPLHRAMTVGEVSPAPPTTIPGDRTGRAIEPGFPAILGEVGGTPEPGAPPRNRLDLARWMTRPDHPMTTRVIVNRVWQGHFGQGLVPTPSDFGRLGEAPSHPELLDWLARRFVRDGWSLKRLHRLIVTSQAYQQSSRPADAEVAANGRRVDPSNRLLWHRATLRLDAESIREAMLATSGELDPTPGGPPSEAKANRRSIYTKMMRNTQDPLLSAFDAPDGSASLPRRNVTTTPTQSLLLINGDWTLGRAGAFAARILREGSTPADRVDRAFRIAFGRPPAEQELRETLAFLLCPDPGGPGQIAAEECGHAPGKDVPDSAWFDFAHALLNANEFLYVD